MEVAMYTEYKCQLMWYKSAQQLTKITWLLQTGLHSYKAKIWIFSHLHTFYAEGAPNLHRCQGKENQPNYSLNLLCHHISQFSYFSDDHIINIFSGQQ